MVIFFLAGLTGRKVTVFCNIDDHGMDGSEVPVAEKESRPDPGGRVIALARVLS